MDKFNFSLQTVALCKHGYIIVQKISGEQQHPYARDFMNVLRYFMFQI